MESSQLKFLVSESGSKFIAHCLDYDLVTCADTFHEAVRRLRFIVAAHVQAGEQTGNLGARAHKAPEQYWNKFEALRADDQGEVVNFTSYSYEVVSTHNAVQ